MKNNTIYSEETKTIARFAKALGHPARIEILHYLSEQTICFTGDIVNVLPLAQSTVSQHLKELKDAGLICGDVKPPKVSYCINQENWKKAQQIITTLFKKGCCGSNCNN